MMTATAVMTMAVLAMTVLSRLHGLESWDLGIPESEATLLRLSCHPGSMEVSARARSSKAHASKGHPKA